MAKTPDNELLGSNDAAITLAQGPVTSHVRLARAPLKTFAASYTRDAMAADKPGEPDRLFLKLRNIRGNQGACIFDISINVAGGAPFPVGSVALFGLEYASKKRSTHGGSGLTKTIEITRATDQHMPELAHATDVIVTIAPRGRLRPDDKITVDQISVYRLAGQ